MDQGLKFNVYDLHGKYKDPNNLPKSKAENAKTKINAAAGLMKQNLGRMLQNADSLGDIESRSQDLGAAASKFRQ